MSDAKKQYVSHLEDMVRIQGEQIEHMQSLIRVRATIDAWASAVRSEPSLLPEFEALLDSDGELPLPPGRRFAGFEVVGAEADTPDVDDAPEAVPETAMHTQLAELID